MSVEFRKISLDRVSFEIAADLMSSRRQKMITYLPLETIRCVSI